MSLKLPLLKAKKIIKVLQKLGFELKRQKGSHMFFSHGDGRTTVIPNHPTDVVDRGLLNKIVKHDLEMSREEFLKYVK
ncbi:addiction module toxin, HicA family [Candidatus Woesearchaeota archaeon]|jgi:predicted RNA binding protein YcfA (HicA-like mRNA interferase family)|nr:addiction module toxin, HicA family [Candidatus Woesearchaeota archaeon]MBT5739976.1 addiction module toxin, HicA family [Candidatus Woesearchaeota archaeon]